MSRGRNTTVVTEFILLGFSDHPELKTFLFVLFLAIYLVTLTWNLGLNSLIKVSPHLHIPMYFFLRHLSFIDMGFSSSVIPKMLSDFYKEQRTISFLGCVTQYFVFTVLGLTECCLLAAMAYDRYAAICTPLLYTTIMSPSLCRKMVVAAYTGGFLSALTPMGLLYRQDFCGPNVIHHFFCDLRPLLSLSCSDTSAIQVVVFIVGVVIGMMSVLVVLLSYGYITVAVLLIRSARGRYKTFATCASHLTTVILYYGSGFFVYMRLNSSYSESRDKVVSLFYSLLIPMLNPLIYSLRNREIRDTLKRLKEKKVDNLFQKMAVIHYARLLCQWITDARLPDPLSPTIQSMGKLLTLATQRGEGCNNFCSGYVNVSCIGAIAVINLCIKAIAFIARLAFMATLTTKEKNSFEDSISSFNIGFPKQE
ncbi:olfactory receptor 5A2-like [Tachyglossus aculeatus]|uniref:olfactory receptor 5A2-like n=1 Tax=Tachyglossus aculeatus TaxID=9261 RepID=UPI0018F30197|nr:olfactory receptor 5A2-like [Tachyglossus aculeatus]